MECIVTLDIFIIQQLRKRAKSHSNNCIHRVLSYPILMHVMSTTTGAKMNFDTEMPNKSEI